MEGEIECRLNSEFRGRVKRYAAGVIRLFVRLLEERDEVRGLISTFSFQFSAFLTHFQLFDSLRPHEPVEAVADRRILDDGLCGPVVHRRDEDVAPVYRRDAVGVLLEHVARRR